MILMFIVNFVIETKFPLVLCTKVIQKVTRAPETGGNFLFQSWHTWHVGVLVVSLFGPACLSAILFSHNKFFRWRGRRALPPPPFCTGRRSFSGFYRDGGMRRRCVTTPQNPKDNLLVASFIFSRHQNVQDEPFSRKSHVICFWVRKGFFLVDFMPKNAEAYCNTLKKNSEEPFRTAEGQC
jgi:hypothetical protein